MTIEKKVDSEKLIREIIRNPHLNEDTKYLLTGIVLTKKIENEMIEGMNSYCTKFDGQIQDYFQNIFR